MDQEMRPYEAVVWRDDLAGERVTIFAKSLDDARRELKHRFGDDIRFSLYNEEDANKPR